MIRARDIDVCHSCANLYKLLMALVPQKQHKNENLKEEVEVNLIWIVKCQLWITAYENRVLQFILHFSCLSLDVSGLQQS